MVRNISKRKLKKHLEDNSEVAEILPEISSAKKSFKVAANSIFKTLKGEGSS